MIFLNQLLLLCQVLIVTLAISFWPAGLDKEQEDGPTCNKPIGQPESLDIGGTIYHYQYDAKGRVLSRRGEFEEIRFQYVWQHDHPTHITQSYGVAGQPEWVKLEQHFVYNQNGDVVYARDSDGRVARLGYNDAGELVWMESLSGVRMEISYDPVCQEISRLGRVGGGSVTYTYDSKCKEIEKKSEGEEFISYFVSTANLLEQPSMDVFH